MPEDNGLAAAVSIAVVDSEVDHRRLLSSVVTVARAIFSAAASSIFLLDEVAGELVFEAVAGEGADHLVGRRFPAGRGIAGWVLAAQEAIVVEDLATNPAFARDFALSTGYVPGRLMAVPLLDGERSIGVLEVLDPGAALPNRLGAMDLLTLFGELAAVALGVVQRSRAARHRLDRDGADLAEVVTLARALDQLSPERRASGLALLNSVTSLIAAAAPIQLSTGLGVRVAHVVGAGGSRPEAHE